MDALALPTALLSWTGRVRGRENNNAYSFCSRYLTTLTVRCWQFFQLNFEVELAPPFSRSISRVILWRAS